MNLKKTLILALVLVIGVLAVTQGLLPHEEAKARDTLVFKGAAPEQFARIVIERSGANFALHNQTPQVDTAKQEVQQTGGEATVSEIAGTALQQWSIESIPGSDLDQGALNALLSSLVQLKLLDADKVPSNERAEDLNEYGLASPALSVTAQVKLASGTDSTQKLLFGNKHDYLPGKRFVKVEGKDDVYLVPESSFTPADKSAADFRNRSPIDFLDSDLNSIAIQKDKERIAFVKTSTGEWRLSEPKSVRASQDAVASLTRELRTLRVAEFIDDGGSRLADFGLATPPYSAQLSFRESAKREPLTIAVAPVAKSDTPEAFFQVSGRPTVFKLTGRNPVDALFKPFNEYREKRLFDFDTASVESVDFTSGSGAILKASLEQGSWKVNGKEGDAAFVLEAIRRLAEVTAVGYPADQKDFGFTVPRFKAVVRLRSTGTEKAPPERVLVAGVAGEKSADGKGTVIMAGDDMSEPFLVSEEVFARLMPTEEQLVKAPVATPNATAATGAEAAPHP